MVGVDELFVLLAATDAPETGALRASTTKILTPDGEVLVALDANGMKHLLVPVGAQIVSPDVRSRGVRITSRSLERDGSPTQYADLECTDRGLALVFERLVSDILHRVAESPATATVVLHQTLDQWRELLRAAGQTDRDAIIGLTGELEVLARLGVANPARALEAWHGPARAVHDFALGSRAIEVKTTASVDGNTIQLSNIDQLDPSGLTALHLVVVHCRERETAPSLDERIRSLVAAGFPEGQLVRAVHAAGYLYESGDAAIPRFEVRSVRAWVVRDDFPGLRRSDVIDGRLRGVSRIKYELALDSAPAPLRGEQVDALLQDWTGPTDG